MSNYDDAKDTDHSLQVEVAPLTPEQVAAAAGLLLLGPSSEQEPEPANELSEESHS